MAGAGKEQGGNKKIHCRAPAHAHGCVPVRACNAFAPVLPMHTHPCTRACVRRIESMEQAEAQYKKKEKKPAPESWVGAREGRKGAWGPRACWRPAGGRAWLPERQR